MDDVCVLKRAMGDMTTCPSPSRNLQPALLTELTQAPLVSNEARREPRTGVVQRGTAHAMRHTADKYTPPALTATKCNKRQEQGRSVYLSSFIASRRANTWRHEQTKPVPSRLPCTTLAGLKNILPNLSTDRVRRWNPCPRQTEQGEMPEGGHNARRAWRGSGPEGPAR